MTLRPFVSLCPAQRYEGSFYVTVIPEGFVKHWLRLVPDALNSCEMGIAPVTISRESISYRILKKHINDKAILWLLERIIVSFHTQRDTGLPLGNLTSQLFVNIYMNEFDQFMKHKLKAKHYIRYADDFVVFSHDKNDLESLLPSIKLFLNEQLKLELHPNKVSIETLASGVDFLGWVHFPTHRVLRTVTKRRMVRRIRETNGEKETAKSCLGLLRHGNTWKVQEQINAIVARLQNVV